MNVRICAAILVMLSGGMAAATAQQTPQGLFQGSPEEQRACRPDASRYCSNAFPDTFQVLACLQAHRDKLRPACRKVLETNGQ